MEVASGHILIGTSGWSYAHWREVFYPPKLPPRDYLAFYAAEFPTVEINSSFYHLPRETTVARWASTTPESFCFSVKASRYLTHQLRLRDCQEPLQTFLGVVAGLAAKLGPLLFQLPPGLHRDSALLAEFLDLLPSRLRIAVEFRHKSWYEEEVFALLASRGVALCVHDLHGCEVPPVVTAPFAYVRLHGPARAYTGSYSSETLAAWAGTAVTWAAENRDVYVYFNNDIGGYAVQNARELQALVASAGPV